MDESTPLPPGTPPAQPSGSPPLLTPPPPPVIPSGVPAPRPQKRGGAGWKVLAFVLLGLLCISLLLNLGRFTAQVGSSPNRIRSTVGPKIAEVLTEDNNSANKIAIVKVEGIITSQPDQGGFSMVELIRAQLEAAAEDDQVKAVVLKVDSPGGEVLASDEINRLILDFQKKKKKPVIGSMGNLAASGGYYVSAPCRWIVANELTITGSIGVMMSSWNYRGLMDKVGLAPQTYKSGKFKDMLSGSREPSEIPAEEREMVQALIDETYARFKDVVASGREAAFSRNQGGKEKSKRLVDNWTEYADGRVFSGVEAFRLGFVDELGNFEDAVARARSIAGIKTADVIEYQQHFDFSDFFRLFGKTETPVIKVDLGVEAPKLRPGCLYFLSSTFAN